MSTLRSGKLATPPLAGLVVVPPSVAPLVPVPLVIATVMPCVAPGTVFPKPSCTVISTGGGIFAPAVALVGWPVKAS